jgi:hypothetical protein
VEHVQPLNRSFPWRTAGLAAALLVAAALLAMAGLELVHRQGSTHPSAAPSRAAKAKTPAIPLRARSRISVLVLNGNGVAHAAGNMASGLLARGYRHAIPTDAANLGYARSLILFRPGWQREAERLARDARIATVAPLDGRVAPEYRSVQLVLILGAS